MARTFRIADIGGTKITTGDVSGTSVRNLRRTSSLPTTAHYAIGFITADLGPEIAAIGVACAGVIRGDDEVVVSPNYHALDGVKLGTALADSIRRPARVINDMHAATLGVIALRPDLSYFTLVNWGTGLAAWTAKNGQILCQSEAGHMLYDIADNAPWCGCGRRGHFESYLGAAYIRGRILEIAELQNKKLTDEEDIWSFMRKVLNHDSPFRATLIGVLTRPMAAFLANLVTMLRPDAIVMRGTFGLKTFPVIEERVRQLMRKHLIIPAWAEIQIQPTPDPQNDALIGVASFLETQLG